MKLFRFFYTFSCCSNVAGETRLQNFDAARDNAHERARYIQLRNHRYSGYNCEGTGIEG